MLSAFLATFPCHDLYVNVDVTMATEVDSHVSENLHFSCKKAVFFYYYTY